MQPVTNSTSQPTNPNKISFSANHVPQSINSTKSTSGSVLSDKFSRLNPLPCNWDSPSLQQQKQLRAVLSCNTSSASISMETVQSNVTPAPNTVNTDDERQCLKRVVQSSICTDHGLRVPRLAHYVWFGKRNLTLTCFASVLSAVRFLRPCLIIFHADHLPSGPYWSLLLQFVANIVHMPHTPPQHIYGNVIKVVQHSADVARLQILLEYGGVYLDTDQYLLQPVDDLRNNSAVIGIEESGVKCGNGLLFSQPTAPFLQLWFSNYVTFNDSLWGEHSTYLPYNLSKVVPPDWVKVVDTFFKPNYKEIMPLYTENSYNWTNHYAIHLYINIYGKFILEKHSHLRLDKQATIIGEMTRHVLYGSKQACLKNFQQQIT